MTFIIGWKKNNTIFLSGDMAISRNKGLNLRKTKSIFGDDLINKKNLSINEECLKLFRINEKVILAFAGKVESALEAIEQIKYIIDETDPLPGLKFVIQRLNKDKFSLFIGLIDKNDIARLFSYNLNGNYKFEEHDEPIQDGSLNSDLKKASMLICKNTSEENFSNEATLAIVNSIHQSLIINENLINQRVGGIFWGLSLTEEGVEWQRDTHYIVYQVKENAESIDSNNPEELFGYSAIIGVVERDNAIRFSSPFLKKGYERSVVYNCMDLPKTQSEFKKKKDIVISWFTNWYEKTDKIFNEFDSEFYCFISKTDKLILPRIGFFTKTFLISEGIKFEKMGGGEVELIVTEDFIESIKPTLKRPTGVTYGIM